MEPPLDGLRGIQCHPAWGWRATSRHPVSRLYIPRVQNPASQRALKWAAVLVPGVAIALLAPPAGITGQSWYLFAIFVSTIAGLIVQPLPGGAMVVLGVTATAVTGVLTPNQALAGYADPIVWLVL